MTGPAFTRTDPVCWTEGLVSTATQSSMARLCAPTAIKRYQLVESIAATGTYPLVPLYQPLLGLAATPFHRRSTGLRGKVNLAALEKSRTYRVMRITLQLQADLGQLGPV